MEQYCFDAKGGMFLGYLYSSRLPIIRTDRIIHTVETFFRIWIGTKNMNFDFYFQQENIPNTSSSTDLIPLMSKLDES